MGNPEIPLVKWFNEISNNDIALVGGKNASLGEMIQHLEPLGIQIPGGFALTSEAYWDFIRKNELEESIRAQIELFKKGDKTLEETGSSIRGLIGKGSIPDDLANAVRNTYRELSSRHDEEILAVAVRSSATAEDLPTASFAGQQETFLNIEGEEALLQACKNCFASLFTDRAISYREKKGFDHMDVALSVGVQRMIRADTAGSGVLFTLDTDTGFPDVMLINAAWGLGENVVKGTVNPDQYLVFKPLLGRDGIKPIIEKKLGSKEYKMVYSRDGSAATKNIPTTEEEQRTYVLNEEEILQLAGWGKEIEKHYETPMDIEWVKDDTTGGLYILQARPETVHSQEREHAYETYTLREKQAEVLLTGESIGEAIATGKVCKVKQISDLEKIEEGCILVTEMTEPDWVQALRNVAGIVTDYGGRTCHAAIVSREMGIPAIVGTNAATEKLSEGQQITISCAEGEMAKVYDGILEFEVEAIDLRGLPEIETDIMLNLATPNAAFQWWKLPVQGVGLARMEFIISQHIRIHPMALVDFDKVEDEEDREAIRKLTENFKDKRDYFVDRLNSGLSKIAASQYPHPVIVRMSDFKTNEYAALIGGSVFEPSEDNPMLGWRGASRYYDDDYKKGFALECRAIKKAREEIGLDNIVVMIPFCRTPEEAERVIEEMKKNELEKGKNGLKIFMMSEIPSNYIILEEFARYFDGFSIGSNDLTQLILGVDRDSSRLSYLFDENNPAVKKAINEIIQRSHEQGLKVSFCGQAPSDDPEFAAFLVDAGIDSISLNPDSVIQVIRQISSMEKRKKVHV